VTSTIQRARETIESSPEVRRIIDRIRAILYGPSDDKLRQESDESHWQPPPSDRSMWWQTVLFALSGFLGSVIITASAPVWRIVLSTWRSTWRLTVPGIPHPGTSTQSTMLFLCGLVLLAVGWLGLIYRAGRIADPRRAVIVIGAVIVLWAIPVSLGPPLLSNDVYSYVAQGEMSSRGLDPSAVGPVALGRNDWTSGADPVWRSAPAPYGPVATAASRAAVVIAGHDPVGAVDVYRVIVWIGVLMAAIGIGMIAVSNGLSAAVAIAIGIGNPIVILHLIGGVHNDALMFGFLVLGLAAAQRDRKVLGVALLTAATAVKIPAAVGLIYLGWCWRGAVASWRERLFTTLAVVGAAIAAIVVGCFIMGLGPGWITALKSTGKVNDTYSPTTKIGFSIAEILNGVGLHVDGQILASGVRALGLLATAVIAFVMLMRSPRVGYIKATGVLLVTYVLLGPVIWPWYLPAGFALLAACGLGRYRPSYLVVCIAVSWAVWPTSVVTMSTLGGGYQHLRGLGVVLAVAALAFGAQRFAGRWERRYEGLSEAERDQMIGVAKVGD
jgi:alpha-1,6-mannosyltransferase